MDPQLLLNRTTPKLTPKITKINSLVEVSSQARKSSTKLKKIFEKGTYQKKTQLLVLNRYKRRLDSIQKQNDKRFARKQRVKVKLPQVKKYVGSFFTSGSDPLKSLAQLAAFNALQKGAKGDILGALGPALVAGGIAFGPSLLKGGMKSLSQRGGGAVPTGPVGRMPPAWWEKNPKSLGRANESYSRYIAGEANIGDRARLGRRGLISASGMFSSGGTEALGKQAGKPLAKQALGRFGKAIIPGAGAAFSFYSANERNKSGDKFGSAVDNIAGSLDAFAAGVQLAAGAAAISGIGLPAAGLIEVAAGIAEVGSFSLDMVNLFRDLTGQSDKEAQKNKLKTQTENQKAVSEKTQGGNLTFNKTLIGYEKVVNKFEEFSKGFTGGMGMNVQQVRETAARIEDLGGGSTPISGPGYEFTRQSSFSQYLTGDPNAAGDAYDPSHGTVDNYHDHLAFKDADSANRAAAFLQSKGITVTELGVSGGHSVGSAHYEGRAFDVPGRQWGGTGAIGPTEYAGSAKVRALMNDFYNLQTQNPQGPQQRQPPEKQSLFTMRDDVAKSLRVKGRIPFQYNGQTYYLLVDQDLNRAIYKNKDPLGLTREYYDFRGNENASLNDAAMKKVNSMFSNASTTSVSTPTPTIPTTPATPVQPATLPPAPRYLEPSYQQQDIVVRYPVIRQTQTSPKETGHVMTSGPSQQDLLNSFYKRVLLNSVA
jgi:hypothetical protein